MSRQVVDLTIHHILNEQPVSQPEVRLLWAIMKRWILDYSGVCARTRADDTMLEARLDAVDWAWSDSNEEFSYLWICEVLDLDAEWLRHIADKSATLAELTGPLGGRIGSLEI